MDMDILSLFVMLAIIFVALKLLPRLLAGVPFIDPKKAHDKLTQNDNALLIDVRTPEEFKALRVPGSVNVEPRNFADDIEEKRPYMAEPVFLMCMTAQRASMAAKTLKSLGFTNISVVEGGLKKWKRLGLPTESD